MFVKMLLGSEKFDILSTEKILEFNLLSNQNTICIYVTFATFSGYERDIEN